MSVRKGKEGRDEMGFVLSVGLYGGVGDGRLLEVVKVVVVVVGGGTRSSGVG